MRRKLMLALGAAALASPLTLHAQTKVWRIGFLSPRSHPNSLESDLRVGPLLKGLHDLDYVEGKNLIIEWRFADGSPERLQGFADELAKLKVDAIVTEVTPATRAAQKSTSTIPVVMGSSADPVVSGFVKSLAHPGGNITGLSSLFSELAPKQLEILFAMVPKLSRVAVLVNPTNTSNAMVLKSIQSAAQRTNAKILPMEARTLPEIEKAFAAMVREKAGAVIVARDGLFISQLRQIAELAGKHRLPSIAGFREYVDAGGLMSYGPSNADMFRRAATFVDKILKGAKPADLPVEQPTKFELVINRKTAKALGLEDSAIAV